MSFARNLANVLHVARDLPTSLNAASIEIVYTERAAAEGLPAEQAGEMADTFNSLQSLMSGGFLSRGPARIEVRPADGNRIVIDIAGHAIGRDVLILLLRLIHNQHQTPPGAFEELVRAIGSETEARRVYAGMDFTDVIGAIIIRADGTDDSRFDPLKPSAKGRLPGLPALDVLEAEEITAAACPPPDAVAEDAWLTLSGLGAFLPLDHQPAFEPGGETFFARGADLVVNDISVETVWLDALFQSWGVQAVTVR